MNSGQFTICNVETNNNLLFDIDNETELKKNVIWVLGKWALDKR